MVAYRYAKFLCSLDDNLVGRLTKRMDRKVLKIVFFCPELHVFCGKISQLVFERPLRPASSRWTAISYYSISLTSQLDNYYATIHPMSEAKKVPTTVVTRRSKRPEESE